MTSKLNQTKSNKAKLCPDKWFHDSKDWLAEPQSGRPAMLKRFYDTQCEKEELAWDQLKDMVEKRDSLEYKGHKIKKSKLWFYASICTASVGFLGLTSVLWLSLIAIGFVSLIIGLSSLGDE